MSTEDFQKLVLARLDRIDQHQAQILTAMKQKPAKTKGDRLIEATAAVRVGGCQTVAEVANHIGLSRSAGYDCKIIRQVVDAANAEAENARKNGFADC